MDKNAIIRFKTDNTLGQQVEFNTKKAMDYAHLHYKDITANEIKGLTPSPIQGLLLQVK